MRSSFNRADLFKQVTLGLLLASTFTLDLVAGAEPTFGNLPLQPTLIAQGDASLPPPDPNYRPRSRFQNDANGLGAGASNQAEDGPIRRRIRRRMNEQLGGDGSAQVSGAPGAAAIMGAPAAAGAAAGVGAGAGAGGRFKNGFGGGGRFKNGFGGGGGGGANMFGKKALDLTSLNLTPEQKQKIQEMRKQVAPKTRELRQQLNAKRQELRDMMFEANAGDDQVRAKRKEVRQLQDKVEDMQINDFLGIRSVLTPDQRLKLTDLKPGNKFAAGNGTQLVAPVVTTP
ncbi:MAG: Spy/CpxP family protein refolding chaperone [Cyanobacteria bacterium SZAS-4]|nr:Spy/CpxP family protein refolding chaperone [Cyanobacteria bacterium SZAS-4]